MAFLILDLDETTFYNAENEHYVHPAHRSKSSISYLNPRFGDDACKLYVINPIELEQLISQAITQHSGVIILTSGLWSRDVLSCIAEQLPLHPAVKDKFLSSPFFSPIEELQYWAKPGYADKIRARINKNVQNGRLDGDFWREADTDDRALIIEWIRRMRTKSTRLNRIMNDPSTAPLFADHYCLMLDNDYGHVQSFETNPRIKAVHATTHCEQSDFYREAQNLLIELEHLESARRAISSTLTIDSVLIEIAPVRPVKLTAGLERLGLFKEQEINTSDNCGLTMAEIASL